MPTSLDDVSPCGQASKGIAAPEQFFRIRKWLPRVAKVELCHVPPGRDLFVFAALRGAPAIERARTRLRERLV
eukprot:2233596-Prymnesium_polylepis.2